MKHPYNLSSSTFLAIKYLRHFGNTTTIDVDLTLSKLTQTQTFSGREGLEADEVHIFNSYSDY